MAEILPAQFVWHVTESILLLLQRGLFAVPFLGPLPCGEWSQGIRPAPLFGASGTNAPRQLYEGVDASHEE